MQLLLSIEKERWQPDVQTLLHYRAVVDTARACVQVDWGKWPTAD